MIKLGFNGTWLNLQDHTRLHMVAACCFLKIFVPKDIYIYDL